jgi:hypothetical protein
MKRRRPFRAEAVNRTSIILADEKRLVNAAERPTDLDTCSPLEQFIL